jgi:hypothetical protein
MRNYVRDNDNEAKLMIHNHVGRTEFSSIREAAEIKMKQERSRSQIEYMNETLLTIDT